MQRVFVVGCPRSGTTIVQAMLARHPRVYSLEETYFFSALLGNADMRWGDRGARKLERWYHRAGMARSSARRRLRELEHIYEPQSRHARSLFRASTCVRHYIALLDCLAEAQCKSHWVEKTPDHLVYIEEIAREVPNARFVHVLRNGLDVIASITDADLHHYTAGFRGGVRMWAARWNRAMTLHLAKAGDPGHHLVCLEDLVADPCAEWERLCAFLGLEADAVLEARPSPAVVNSRVEPWKSGAAAGTVEHPRHKARSLFGPRMLSWLESHLTDYHAVRAAIECNRRIGAQTERHGGTSGRSAVRRAAHH